MSKKNQPYLALYVQDFMTDEKLAECSAGANGVYIRIMCLLTKTEVYGKFLLKQNRKQTGKQTRSKRPSKRQANNSLLLELCFRYASQLVKHMPYDVDTIKDGLYELLNEKVLQIEGDYLIQKRMVKDAAISHKRSVSGKKGGENRVKNMRDNKGNAGGGLVSNFAQANSKQNADNDNDNTSIYNEGGAGGNFSGELKHIPDDIAGIYNLPFEEFMKMDENEIEGVELQDFEDWRRFVQVVDSDPHNFHEFVFIARKFIFPKDMAFLKRKGFSEDLWLPVLEKLGSVGLEQKHNLRFRIPDAMKWLKKDSPRTTGIDQSVKQTGNKETYTDNKF